MKTSRVKADTSRFASPATEAEAYWLGFLFTDGCISGDKIVINLAGVDAGHLTKLADFFGSPRRPRLWSKVRETPKGERVERRYATFTLTSFVIAGHLTGLGLHPDKTWNVRPWSGPPELMRHFWRGCVDGDGSIHESRKLCRGRPHLSWRLHFCGNANMVRGFAAFISDRTGLPAHVREVRTNGAGETLYAVRWEEKAAAEIVRLLYGDSTVSLDRKREAAERLLLRRRSRSIDSL